MNFGDDRFSDLAQLSDLPTQDITKTTEEFLDLCDLTDMSLTSGDITTIVEELLDHCEQSDVSSPLKIDKQKNHIKIKTTTYVKNL